MKYIIIGFMGAGKTTYGRNLARINNLSFYDLDNIIESKTGRTISDIFSREGEAAFREIEYSCFLEFNSETEEDYVLSLGGGTLTYEPSYKVINSFRSKPDYNIIFLDTSFNVCYKRILNSERPLAALSKKELQNIFIMRRPLYLKCSNKIIKNYSIQDKRNSSRSKPDIAFGVGEAAAEIIFEIILGFLDF